MMTQAASEAGRTIGTPVGGRNGLGICFLGIALLEHALLVSEVMLPRNKGIDFLLMYNGSRVPMTGRSPYEPNAVDYEHPVFRDAARDKLWVLTVEAFKADNQEQIGLFYPPQAYLVFYPPSRLLWHSALAYWTVFLTLAVMACGSLTWTFDLESQCRSPTVEALVIAAFLLHPVTELNVSLGQTTLLMCSGVALGQRARRAGYFWLAAFLWSFAMIKPQLGILLCAPTLLVGGWRFCAATALMAVGLNLLGGLATTGDPLMILGLWTDGQMVVGNVNNTARSDYVVSWVRDVYVLTGYEIAMTPTRNLAGLCSWIGLVLGAAWPRGGLRWALPYWLATAAAGSLAFGLAHGYDLVIFILLVPYIFWLYDRAHRRDWIFLAGLITVAAIPLSALRALASRLGPGMAADVLVSHRAFLVLILAVYLLIRGQPAYDGVGSPFWRGTRNGCDRPRAILIPPRGGYRGPVLYQPPRDRLGKPGSRAGNDPVITVRSAGGNRPGDADTRKPIWLTSAVDHTT
jgi:hypothetical protein